MDGELGGSKVILITLLTSYMLAPSVPWRLWATLSYQVKERGLAVSLAWAYTINLKMYYPAGLRHEGWANKVLRLIMFKQIPWHYKGTRYKMANVTCFICWTDYFYTKYCSIKCLHSLHKGFWCSKTWESKEKSQWATNWSHNVSQVENLDHGKLSYIFLVTSC